MFSDGAMENTSQTFGAIGSNDEEYNFVIAKLEPEDEIIEDPWTQDGEVNEDELPEEEEIAVEETIMTQVEEVLAEKD